MERRSALLIGGTGLVGSHCRRYLLKDPAYAQVNLLVRRRTEAEHAKLRQHEIDFDRLDRASEILQADDVFCCLGTTIKKAGSQAAFRKVDFTYVLQIAALSARNGSKQFLTISSLGANTSSRVFYSRVKGEMEEALAKLSFQAIHIFRPSLLLGDRREVRTGERLAAFGMTIGAIAMVGPWRKYRAIQAASVARAMVRVARRNIKGLHIYESAQIQSIADENDETILAEQGESKT